MQIVFVVLFVLLAVSAWLSIAMMPSESKCCKSEVISALSLIVFVVLFVALMWFAPAS